MSSSNPRFAVYTPAIVLQYAGFWPAICMVLAPKMHGFAGQNAAFCNSLIIKGQNEEVETVEMKG